MFCLSDYKLFDVTVDYIQTINYYDGCQELRDSEDKLNTTTVRIMTRWYNKEKIKHYIENIYFDKKREPKVTNIEQIKMIDKMLIDVGY